MPPAFWLPKYTVREKEKVKLMREELYITEKNAILNYSAAFYQSAEELLNGEGFRLFMENYLKNLAVRDIKVYS